MTTTVNEQELEIVERLSDRLASWLGDRDGTRHPPPWEPRQHVVLGVLRPTISRPPPPSDVTEKESTSQESTDQVADPSITELLPADDATLPSMGLTFKVGPSTTPISLNASFDFALYVEEYPTFDEQRAYLGTQVNEQPIQEDVTATSPVPGTAAASDHQAGAATPANSTRAPRRGRRVSVLGAWRRIDLHVEGISLEIPLTEEHVKVTLPLMNKIREAIDLHFAGDAAARPFLARTRTVSIQDLADESRFRKALREAADPNFLPLYPQLEVTGFAQPLAEGYLVSVSLTNVTILPGRPFQDLAAYDCRAHIRLHEAANLQPQRFHLAPRDYRYLDDTSLVWGQGNGCVVERSANGDLNTTTLPRYYQPVVVPRDDHVPAPKWEALASSPANVLDGIAVAMRRYLEEWDTFLRSAEERVRQASQRERDAFAAELDRYCMGRRAMLVDARLATAFEMANSVFADANAAKGYDRWRLFQIVYIVSHLPALAAREHRSDAEFVAELDYADVLWVPTGGGKTEAYLGLLVVALFYDRLRGKACGITAWLKFPLRMLSVQQLARVLRVLVVAERYRQEKLGSAGEPFELGYLVGGSNTPNSLRYDKAWWPGFDAAKSQPVGHFDEHRLVAQCPYCDAEAVGLDVDGKAIRLRHICRSCHRTLPIYMSDEEIYRYMPSVLVGTVDKLTGFAFFGEFTQFNHGPRWRCPDHGGFSFREGGKCIVGDKCLQKTRAHEVEDAWYDPVPALIIQDEMHLLREELGVFDAHYEGMLSELQRSSRSGLPSKILAASATIEQYEHQLRQIYGRRPRSFPSPGYERTRSFYTVERADTRRLYVGVLPHYRRKADVGAIVQTNLMREVTRLQDEAAGLGRPDRAALLFNYETSLAYVNSKMHGDQIADELGRLSDLLADRGEDRITFRVLTGQVKIAELAEPISRIEQDTLAVPRTKRIRGLVGTSVVSHGVDLARLNVLVMAGLPTTVADYIQASSRSGRVHAGLIVTVFDTFSRRERSAFTNFVSFHRFLDRMVEPVPVNKYAFFGARRTLPGIVLALLWDMARDPEINGPEEGVRRTRSLQPWWNANGARLKPILQERLERCYRSLVAGVNEAALERELVERVLARWVGHELQVMQRFDHDRSKELFAERVLTSFRDVDEPVDFSALPQSAEAFEALTGNSSRERAATSEDQEGGE